MVMAGLHAEGRPATWRACGHVNGGGGRGKGRGGERVAKGVTGREEVDLIGNFEFCL